MMRYNRAVAFVVVATTATAPAQIVTQNGVHRITRMTVNCGADTGSSAVLCDSQQGPVGLRIVPNVAEAVLSPDTLTNSSFRLRVGLLVPRISSRTIADCNAN